MNSTGGSQNVLESEAPNVECGVNIEKRGRKGGGGEGEPPGPELWNKENDSIVVIFPPDDYLTVTKRGILSPGLS